MDDDVHEPAVLDDGRRLTLHEERGFSTNALTVDQPPSFASAASVTFTAGVSKTFTVLTKGYPAARLTESGTLPSGIGPAKPQLRPWR